MLRLCLLSVALVLPGSVSIARAQIGACCSPTGTCIETTREICEESGREYLGDGTSCTPNPCAPAPTGACCFPDTTCQVLPMPDCAAAGGIFQGEGEPCDPLPCGPIGACCLVGPLCTIAEQSDCFFGDGEYQGDGTTCTPDPCTATDANGRPVVPDGLFLSPPFPNPTRGTFRYGVGLPGPGRVRVRIFDVRGALVAAPWEGHLPAGVHAFDWSAPAGDRRVAPGIYFLRVEADGEARTRRVVLAR